MRLPTPFATALALVFVVLPVSAQNDVARAALERYRALRPTDDDLAMYRLDWVESLDEAKRRAAAENRPVLVIAVHARYGDLYTGHC